MGGSGDTEMSTFNLVFLVRRERKLDTRLPLLMTQKVSAGRLERRVKLQEPALVAFEKASWDTDKTARCTEDRQGSRGDFDEAEINAFSWSFLAFLPSKLFPGWAYRYRCQNLK